MIATTPSLSAWTLPQVPPLVSHLENAFVRSLERNLPSMSSLSADARLGLESLLRRGASPRLLGDALYLGQMHRWVESRNRQLTGDAPLRISFHGPERLFEPFPAFEQDPVPANVPEFRSRFLEGFDRLDNVARAVVEIEGPPAAFLRTGDELMTGGYSMYLAPLLRPYGLHLFNHKDMIDADPNGTFVFRHLSLSALEMGLRIFVGDAAVRFCMAPGLVTERQNNDLHKMGYHPVGYTLGRKTIHGSPQSPPICILHDAGHGAQWSVRVPPRMRVAASVLNEVMWRSTHGLHLPECQTIREALGDLELGERADLAGLVMRLKKALKPRHYRVLLQDWRQELHKAAKDLNDDQFLPYADSLIRFQAPKRLQPSPL